MVMYVEDMPVHISTVDTSLTRVRVFPTTFTYDFYWKVKREHERDLDPTDVGYRNPWYNRAADASCPELSCKWDEMLRIEVSVHELEWSTGEGWQIGRKYASTGTEIKLTCPTCFT